jgi:hypothetical protein
MPEEQKPDRTWLAVCTAAGVAVDVTLNRYSSLLPLWVVVAICSIPVILFAVWIWKVEKATSTLKQQLLKYPVSYVVMFLVLVVVGWGATATTISKAQTASPVNSGERGANIQQHTEGNCSPAIVGDGNTYTCNSRIRYPDLNNAQAHALVDTLAAYDGRRLNVQLVQTGASQETMRFGTHLTNALAHCRFQYSSGSAFIAGNAPAGITATLNSNNLHLLKAIEVFLQKEEFIRAPVRYTLVDNTDAPLTIFIAEPQQETDK